MQAEEAVFTIAIVHVAPYVEYWDARTWQAGDSSWGNRVRDRWLPLLVDPKQCGSDLVVSGLNCKPVNRSFTTI